MLPEADGGQTQGFCPLLPRRGPARGAGLHHDGQPADALQHARHHGLQDGHPVSRAEGGLVT